MDLIPDGFDPNKHFKEIEKNRDFWIQVLKELKDIYYKLRNQFGNKPQERELGHFINTCIIVRLYSILEQSGAVEFNKKMLVTRIGNVSAERKIQLLFFMRNAYAHAHYYNEEDSNQKALRLGILKEFDVQDWQNENYSEFELPADRRKVIEPLFDAAEKFLTYESNIKL